MWNYTKRSSFLLLEVFIVLSLLCLALHSLLSIPSLCFHKELRMLKEVEITRLEDVAYMELLEKLPHILPLVSMGRGKEGNCRIELTPQVIHLAKDVTMTYNPSAIFWIQKESNGLQLLRCNILFDKYIKKLKSNKKFMYKIIVHETEQQKIHNFNRSTA
ncbi:MAG: hypothetical protein ACRCSV_05640 [Chlamydiales bacterium]